MRSMPKANSHIGNNQLYFCLSSKSTPPRITAEHQSVAHSKEEHIGTTQTQEILIKDKVIGCK